MAIVARAQSVLTAVYPVLRGDVSGHHRAARSTTLRRGLRVVGQFEVPVAKRSGGDGL